MHGNIIAAGKRGIRMATGIYACKCMACVQVYRARVSSAVLHWEHQLPGDVSRVASAVLKGKRLADRATTVFR